MMPRTQRIKGEFTTYHVVQRGNERKNIFKSENDKTRFLETIAKAREKYNFLVYSYCLMDNHIHLLINDNGNDISKIMKSINVSYVWYFNKIYSRYGHLFQDRFESETVLDERYLLEVSRYIHNNPVKAGLVDKPEQYKWSSYNIITGKTKDYLQLINSEKILICFAREKRKAVTGFIEFVTKINDTDLDILDIEEETLPVGTENHSFIADTSMAKKRITQILIDRQMSMEELISSKANRDDMIKELRKNSKLSLKEIGILVGGLSESQVSRIIKGS